MIAGGQAIRPKIDGPLSVAAAIGIATSNNPGLAAARSQLASTTAGVRSARAELGPQISANSFASAGSYNSILNSSPGSMPPYWLNVPSGGFLDQNIMLMVPLFTGGRLDAAIRAASWRERAALGDLAEMQADTSLRVQDAYLKALVARQMTTVQLAKVGAAEELLKTTQADFDAGKGIQASVYRVQAELSHAQRLLTSSGNDAAKALLDLDAAMGADFSSTITLTDELALAPDTETLDRDLANAMKSRGRLIASRARAEATGANIRAIEGKRSPQLYGQAMGDIASPRSGTGSTFGLTLSFPLFDSGRINEEVNGAKAERNKAKAEEADATVAVENEVRQAWLDVETGRANAASAELSVKSAQAAYDVIALRLSVGKAILVEQLDALEALTEARADLAQAIYEHNIALAKLIRASGGTK